MRLGQGVYSECFTKTAINCTNVCIYRAGTAEVLCVALVLVLVGTVSFSKDGSASGVLLESCTFHFKAELKHASGNTSLLNAHSVVIQYYVKINILIICVCC